MLYRVRNQFQYVWKRKLITDSRLVGDRDVNCICLIMRQSIGCFEPSVDVRFWWSTGKSTWGTNARDGPRGQRRRFPETTEFTVPGKRTSEHPISKAQTGLGFRPSTACPIFRASREPGSSIYFVRGIERRIEQIR